MTNSPKDEFDKIVEGLEITPDYDISRFESFTEQDIQERAEEQPRLYADDFVDADVLTNVGQDYVRLRQIDRCALGPICIVYPESGKEYRIVIIGSLLKSSAMEINPMPSGIYASLCNKAIDEKQGADREDGLLYYFLPHGIMTGANLCYARAYLVDELHDIGPQHFGSQGAIMGSFTLLDTNGRSGSSLYAISDVVKIEDTYTEYAAIEDLHA